MRGSRGLFLLLLMSVPAAAMSDSDKLWHHRNLGKAFYENSATQYEAVEEFRKALALAPDSARERLNYGLALLRSGKVEEGVAELEKAQGQDSSIPHTWFNLGIAYKQQSRYEDAIRQLEGMVKRVPDEAISHYNLGVLYKLEKQTDRALEHFEKAAALDPGLAGPHFQLATAYRQSKRPADAKREMAAFRKIKKQQAGAAVPEDLEWSWYSEIYEVLEPKPRRPPPGDLSFVPAQIAGSVKAEGLVVLDAEGDGVPDLLAWGPEGVVLYSGGSRRRPSGLETLKGIAAMAPGDFDNDGLVDLAVVRKAGQEKDLGKNGPSTASLLRNLGGSFERVSVELPAGPYNSALWLDYDHDYDLDLLLLGKDSRLLRNNGIAGFSDETASFPFVTGEAVAGTALDAVADTQGVDLAVVHGDRSAVLYRDRLGGRYEATNLSLPAAVDSVEAHDLDNDGWTDLVAGGPGGLHWLANDGAGGFGAATLLNSAPGPFTVADFENRSAKDVVSGGKVLRQASGGGIAQSLEALERPKALAAADFDGNGMVDLVAAGSDGTLRLLRNRTATPNRWMRVALTGVKNLKLAPGAEVEVKAGARYQKKIYQGYPLHFGLGRDEQVDTVRITWPNGLIQNEARRPAGASYAFEEAQRLSGSCPMIFTWNGEEFEFITDVLGVAPLGASSGDGEYFPVDNDEYVQIPGEALATVDGRYEIRVTEELREVAFLDAVRLIALDHPEAVEIFTNDKFKGPPFPEFRLFGVERRIHPRAARDHRGTDVGHLVAAKDQRYPDAFERDYAGVAELHHLELDFGDAAATGEAVLILSGWVDWADGSTFLGASQQSPQGLVMPYLQVKDEEGRWRTVIEDMGIPAGKPKTIAVDLTGKFLSASREIRIVTNLCVYWDEIFLTENVAPPPVRRVDLLASEVELRFRGFSGAVIHPERKQPERFVYAERRPLSMWNPTRGLYTRYGKVTPLLETVDDRFVIMGSGDELRFFFDATALPALEEGWRRDFLLLVDGWAKDGDANTAHSQTVGPLPYHGMPQYPYEEPHGFPDDGIHQRYLEHYVTRPALRLIRPLAEESSRR